MIGIKFKIPNEYDTILDKILRGVATINDYWNVSNDEVYKLAGEFFFKKEKYSYEDFNNIIKSEDYYPVFLTLQLYSLKCKSSDIKNYEDYIKSDCKMLMTIIDNEFVSVYSKDEKILEQIKYNVKKNRFSDISNVNEPSGFCLYF